MKFQFIDRYRTLPPKYEWIESFFYEPDSFFLHTTLSNNQSSYFRYFLKDVGIINNVNKFQCINFSEEGKILLTLDLKNSNLWAIMLINASYTAFFNFFVKTIKPYRSYCSTNVNLELIDIFPKSPKGRLLGVYLKLCHLPFGTKLGLGKVTEEGKETYFQRGTWVDPEPLVILYALYKFAVACGDYYEFTLTRLLDHDIDSDGVSPTEIFCLDRETMVPILKGLAINYPEFISVTFTHDLDAISLNREKAPIDVLRLIAGGQTDRG